MSTAPQGGQTAGTGRAAVEEVRDYIDTGLDSIDRALDALDEGQAHSASALLALAISALAIARMHCLRAPAEIAPS